MRAIALAASTSPARPAVPSALPPASCAPVADRATESHTADAPDAAHAVDAADARRAAAAAHARKAERGPGHGDAQQHPRTGAHAGAERCTRAARDTRAADRAGTARHGRAADRARASRDRDAAHGAGAAHHRGTGNHRASTIARCALGGGRGAPVGCRAFQRRTLARADNLRPAMTSIAVTGYQLSVWVHISAVVVGLGATFAESIMFPVAMSLNPRHLPYVHRLQIAINQRLASPALAVILATGIYQAADGDWDFGSFWISASILIVIALGALNGAYFIPTDRRLGAMVEREVAAAGEGEVALSEEYQRRARTEGIFGAVAGVLVIVAIYLMVVKPGA